MRLILLLAAGSLLLSQAAIADDCVALATKTFHEAKLATAEANGAGPFALPATPPFKEHDADLPAYCRIRGEAEPHIGFELWLPAKWNGRLVAVGSGGFGGVIGYRDMAPYLVQGYAVTANDTGHTDQSYAWMHDPQSLYAWGHSATHAVIDPVKKIVRAYYGKPAAYSYFLGCSTGAAQAMEEAEFYPGDFNGISASCPGMYYSHLMLSFLWGLKATSEHAVLSADKLQLLHAAVMAQCDERDGAKDGLLENPLACHFDPRTLLCKDGSNTGCLTDEEVKTADLIYRGPRNPSTGEEIYPGFVPGSESSPDFAGPMAVAYSWTLIQGPLAKQYAVPLMKNLAFGEAWDWRSFDFDKDVVKFDAAVHDKIDSVNPDLRVFQQLGGKLIMVQGWGDPFNAQTLPIEYRERVIGVFAGDKGKAAARRAVDSFFRLFMAPGMSHCMGGPGPSKYDALAALRDWVEKSRAPRRLVAHKTSFVPSSSDVAMSRPLCPHPQVAHWTGKGSMNEATNFACIRPGEGG